MASTYLYKGKAVATPSAFADVNASALEPTNVGSTGIVAIIGSATGGKPISAMTGPEEVPAFSTDAQARRVYTGGDLLEAIPMAFNPSSDPLVPGGAAQVVALKVGQDTAATLNLTTNSGASDVIALTSANYGDDQNQVNVVIGAGTTAGKAATINYLDESDAADNLGDPGVMSIDFEPGSGYSWDNCGITVGADGSTTAHSSRSVSLYESGFASHSAGDIVNVTANAANNGDTLTVWGLDGSGNVINEVLTISGGAATGSTAFASVHGMAMSAPASTGNCVVTDDSAHTLATFAFASSQQYKGMLPGIGLFVEGYPTVSEASGVSTKMILVGTGTNGAETSEVFTFTGTANQRLLGTTKLTNITWTIGGLVNAAITVRANAGQTLPSTYNTIQRVHDYYEDRISSGVGFTVDILTGSTASAPTIMDEVLDADGYDNGSSQLVLRDEVQQIINWFNTGTEYATAALASTITRPVWNYTVAATASFSWAITISGTAVTHILPGSAVSATAARDALVQNFNRNPELNKLLVASASGTAGLVITGRGGLGAISLATPSGLTAGSTTAVVGRKTPPDNLSPAAFFTGGATVDPVAADWTQAFTFLRQLDVNTIVPLTGDASVHAELKTHVQYMRGRGAGERDGVVGLVKVDSSGDPDLTSAGLWQLATKAELKSQIVDLNDHDLRCCGQSIDWYALSGVRTTFPPWYQAVIVAGMQAGAPLGEPLTRKVANVLGIAQHSGWNPKDDSDEMIQAGLWFMENVSGLGRRCVRNVTSHLSSNNLAYVEASTNFLVNLAKRELRATANEFVGRPGRPLIVQAAKTRIGDKADALVDRQIINGWRSLSVELSLDVLRVDIELAAPVPINFVPVTIFLVNNTITA